MLNELKTLCTLSGVSGCEDQVRDYIISQAKPHAHSIDVDLMGNLIVRKKGAVSAPDKLMVCAHMDEVGIIVRSITDDGYLKFAFVGGVDRRVAIGKRVLIGANSVPGVIGIKAYHLVSRDEEKSVPQLDGLYIDIGAKEKETAENMVSVGDYGVFNSDSIEFGNGFLKAKALDDRVGCAAMLALLREDLPMDVTFVFTVQEEVGTRGAFGAAFSVKPKIALVLETTTAADIPATNEHQRVCSPGKGPVISWMDGGTIYDRALFERMRDIAAREDIPWQLKHYLAGGTDARALQRSCEGVRVAGLAAAVRYLHAPSSVGAIKDFDDMLRLARGFIADIAKEI